MDLSKTNYYYWKPKVDNELCGDWIIPKLIEIDSDWIPSIFTWRAHTCAREIGENICQSCEIERKYCGTLEQLPHISATFTDTVSLVSHDFHSTIKIALVFRWVFWNIPLLIRTTRSSETDNRWLRSVWLAIQSVRLQHGLDSVMMDLNHIEMVSTCCACVKNNVYAHLAITSGVGVLFTMHKRRWIFVERSTGEEDLCLFL